MGTKSRRSGLRALQNRKRKNRDRVARGLKPIVKGRKVSARSIGQSKRKARKNQAKARRAGKK